MISVRMMFKINLNSNDFNQKDAKTIRIYMISGRMLLNKQNELTWFLSEWCFKSIWFQMIVCQNDAQQTIWIHVISIRNDAKQTIWIQMISVRMQKPYEIIWFLSEWCKTQYEFTWLLSAWCKQNHMNSHDFFQHDA